MLRPRTVRDLGRPKEDADLFVHPKLVGQGEFQSVLEGRHQYARSSHRNSLVPVDDERGGSGVKS